MTRLVDQLEESSIIGNASRAVTAASAPQIQRPNSITTQYELTLGDLEEFPKTSLSISVIVSKAVASAATPSMKKLSALHQPKGGGGENVVEPTKKRKRADDEDEEMVTIEEEAMPHLARQVAEEVAKTYGVQLDKNFFYVPIEKFEDFAKFSKKTADRDENEENEEKPEEEPEDEPVEEGKQLSKAYKLGRTVIPLGDIGEEETLRIKHKPGLQIIGFAKASQVSCII